ncbi:unnamed protein product [Brachionus calyciflorus]|uniref:Uncharacterized protein n=1 Tax=Brachionus calyciflorus TaxID=104777 RepID=A0A814C3Q3_9BILA|nr:unnamed protein product [Brachionus calyciflorus]
MIKSMLGISHRCTLLHALNIEPTKMRINNARIDFFMRLMDNEYTKYVILENKQTIFDEICKMVDVNIDDPAEIIIEACKIEKVILKEELKLVKCNNNYVKIIKNIFDSKDKTSIPKQLYDVLKF